MTESRSIVPQDWKEVGEGSKGEITKRHKETFRSRDMFTDLDCGDSFTGVYICQNSSKFTF